MGDEFPEADRAWVPEATDETEDCRNDSPGGEPSAGLLRFGVEGPSGPAEGWTKGKGGAPETGGDAAASSPARVTVGTETGSAPSNKGRERPGVVRDSDMG